MSVRTLLTVLTALAVVFAFTGPAVAGSVSITSVSSPDSVVQGDSFTVDVSVSGNNVQGNQIDVSLSLPSGLSCSQTTQTVSPGGTASFSCTGDSAGDYTGEISISTTATDGGDGSTLTASDQTGLEVLTPASLTMTTSLTDSSIDVGGSTSYTVVINNVGDASTTYSLSLAGSSGYSTTVTSGSTSGPIDGSTTESVTYSVTGDGEGTHALDPTVNAGNGQTLTESDSITVNTAGTPTPAPDGGGGGGGETTGPDSTEVSGVATENGEAEVSVEQVSADEPVSVSLDGIETDSISVAEVEADFSESTDDGTSMTVTASPDRPADAPDAPTDTVVGYVTVDVEDDMSEAVAEGTFTVDVSDADVAAEDATAYRYHDGEWSQVETEAVGDGTIRVLTPGYSTFAVGTTSGVTGADPTSATTPAATPPPSPSTPTGEGATPDPAGTTPSLTPGDGPTPTQAGTPSPGGTPTPGASGPGFTPAVALLALLVALVLRRTL